ncbi:MAG TPA: sensor histidine kinase, partial [Arenibacter sp.]|nr:sensor histidine kinase [Arenibacter sp.]
MVISTVALYFYVKQLMQREVEEELYSTRARVESSLRINKPPYSLPPVFEVEQVAQLGNEKVKDTIIYDPSQDEMEEFRELISYKSINGNYYRITVRNLIVESEDILIAIILSYMFIILLVFLIQFYFNRAKNKKLWDPFFRNLEAMKTFSLSSDTP